VFLEGSVDLSTLHTDLFLACASLEGVPGARELLEAHAMADAPKAVRRVAREDDLIEEVVADLRLALLSPIGDKAPLLTRYQGRGPLKSFVLVLATRRALDRKRRQREVLTDRADLGVLSGSSVDGGERQRLEAEFLAVFKKHLDRLPPRERSVLREHVVKGVSLDTLARTHGAHRATVARWIASAKQAVFDATRAELSERKSWGSATFQSFARHAAVDMDATLSTFLDEGTPPER
jgi:RNA polymerase sigma-70 factor, ECF subfamily